MGTTNDADTPSAVHGKTAFADFAMTRQNDDGGEDDGRGKKTTGSNAAV